MWRRGSHEVIKSQRELLCGLVRVAPTDLVAGGGRAAAAAAAGGSASTALQHRRQRAAQQEGARSPMHARGRTDHM